MENDDGVLLVEMYRDSTFMSLPIFRDNCYDLRLCYPTPFVQPVHI